MRFAATSDSTFLSDLKKKLNVKIVTCALAQKHEAHQPNQFDETGKFSEVPYLTMLVTIGLERLKDLQNSV